MKVALFFILFVVGFAYANFEDITMQAGVSYEQQPLPLDNCLFNRCIPQGMTGGVAAGDYNNDGRVDFAVTRLFERDILYRNNGDGTFTDVSMSAGLGDSSIHRSNGVLWCDIDNDNDLDLFVTTLGNGAISSAGNRFYLYVNNGDGTFSEDAVRRGVAEDDGTERFGTSATCGDYNNDGLLDLHVNQWNQMEANITKVHTKLFRNTGNGFFEDDSARHEFDYSVAEVNFASTFVDMDKDGDQDLLISADFRTSQYYENVNGVFRDRTESSLCCGEGNGMGTTFADINGDGYLDWFISAIGEAGDVTQHDGNRFYLNDRNNGFIDYTDESGLRYASWGWGCIFFDMDNDADSDLIVTNGQLTNIDLFKTDVTRVFENVNGNGQNFVEKQEEYGVTDNNVGKSAIAIDFDNDGDMDVAISQTGPGLILYENKFNNNNGYLKIRTPGTVSNVQGIGAQINVWINEGDSPIYQQMGVNSHYLGHGDPTVAHFGLGAGSSPVFKVQVYWPVSGITVERTNVQRNSVITLVEEVDEPTVSSESTVDQSTFDQTTIEQSTFDPSTFDPSTFDVSTAASVTFSASTVTFSQSSNDSPTDSPNDSDSSSDASSIVPFFYLCLLLAVFII